MRAEMSKETELNAPPTDGPVKKKRASRKKAVVVEPIRKGRKFAKKTCYEDSQAPLNVCNQISRQVSLGLKEQQFQAYLDHARSILAQEKGD